MRERCGIPSTSRRATTRRPGRRAARGRPAVDVEGCTRATARSGVARSRGCHTGSRSWSRRTGARYRSGTRQPDLGPPPSTIDTRSRSSSGRAVWAVCALVGVHPATLISNCTRWALVGPATSGMAPEILVVKDRDHRSSAVCQTPTNTGRRPPTPEHVHAANTVCGRERGWSATHPDSFRFNSPLVCSPCRVFCGRSLCEDRSSATGWGLTGRCAIYSAD
jgi:hypothetical protein